MAVAVLMVLSPTVAAQSPSSLLGAAFQDHAVLQRNTPITVWGTATPGETITVEMAGETAQAKVGSSGRWTTELSAQPAGGPHALEVRLSEGRAQTVTDVLVGEVFLCAGQSNMALPVTRALNAPTEIRNATNERLRMMEVGQATSPMPRDTFSSAIEWEVAAPETVPDWSATCYYFARELQQNVDVPIGLINSSWGGSKISAWMSRDALASVDGYGEALPLLRLYAEDQSAAQQTFGEKWEAWWRRATGDTTGTAPWQPSQTGAAWSSAPEGLGNWKEWENPELQNFNGMLWLRTTVELTEAQASRDAVLSLGAIDEVDQTWINGQVVGNTFGYGTERTYAIPAEQLREGENVVVVNVLNTYGAGGMVGDPAKRALIVDEERLPLETWRHKKAPSDVGSPPRAPWEPVGGLSTIHNAMVAPLHDYPLKGIVWYQGESDTGTPDQYQAMLEALMAHWREQFGTELPVLVVQLANYGPPPTEPEESGWAEVREAQRLATRHDALAGLAVTIDIGSAYDIHPANKQEVGRRLARAARHVMYGEQVTPSGPVPERAVRRGNTVTVTFDDIDGSLVAYGHSAPIGFELCGEEPRSCQYVDARIDGAQVHLRAENESSAARVRYCWADSPICTLYDEAGLPAGPFELNITD